MTMQLHKEVDHKNSELIPIFYIFFIELLDLSERKLPQRFEAPPAPQIYGLLSIVTGSPT